MPSRSSRRARALRVRPPCTPPDGPPTRRAGRRRRERFRGRRGRTPPRGSAPVGRPRRRVARRSSLRHDKAGDHAAEARRLVLAEDEPGEVRQGRRLLGGADDRVVADLVCRRNRPHAPCGPASAQRRRRGDRPQPAPASRARPPRRAPEPRAVRRRRCAGLPAARVVDVTVVVVAACSLPSPQPPNAQASTSRAAAVRILQRKQNGASLAARPVPDSTCEVGLT